MESGPGTRPARSSVLILRGILLTLSTICFMRVSILLNLCLQNKRKLTTDWIKGQVKTQPEFKAAFPMEAVSDIAVH